MVGSRHGENGITYTSISIIWFVSLNVYMPVWLNLMWVTSVSMVALLFSRLFMTAPQGFLT